MKNFAFEMLADKLPRKVFNEIDPRDAECK
jgi:hypothetical protein